MKTILVLIALTIIALFTLAVPAAANDVLVGTWRLVSATSHTDTGEVNKEVYGKDPEGTMVFTKEGRMMTLIAMGGRKSLSVPDRVSAPIEERAEAFSTFIAYGGRYSLSGDNETLHIEISSLQNWVNSDQVRFVSIQGNRLILRTPPMPRGGVKQTFELTWERLR